MAAPFSPRANTIFWIILGMLLGTPAAAVGALMLYARSPQALEMDEPLGQPVQFDHRHHAADEGIDCRYCHDTVERSPYAGVPEASKCMNCHAQIWNDSSKLEVVRQSVFEGKPLLWNKVHRLADFVYFNHSIHVTSGVGCVTCHGRVDQMPLVRRAVPLTMSWCLDCHRDPAPYLRPKEEITNMQWRPDEKPEVLGRALMQQYGVKPRTDCYTCHR